MRLAALLCLGSVLTLQRSPRARLTSSYIQWLHDTSPPALHPTSPEEAIATFPTALQPSTVNDLIQIFTLPIKSSNYAETEVTTFEPHSLVNVKLKNEEQKTLKQLRHILQTLLESITETRDSDAYDANENQHVYIIDINTTEEIQPDSTQPTTQTVVTITTETIQEFQSDSTTEVPSITFTVESDLSSTQEISQSNYTTEVSDEEIANTIDSLNKNIENIPIFNEEKDEEAYMNDSENDEDTDLERENDTEEENVEEPEEETRAMRQFLQIVRLLEDVVPDLNAYLDNPLQNITDKEAAEKAFAILAILKNSLCTSQENTDIQEDISKLIQNEVKILRLLMKKHSVGK
uniref:Ring-infected erythrocyte surface antigen-like n=1 Tax=Geotrypetes seraphini TaxID=260995 RepID=A0A6P8PLT3_GEOSA|nr:ring-infected erythrocyte surface antigen-like [Geotrypetes seraphini]